MKPLAIACVWLSLACGGGASGDADSVEGSLVERARRFRQRIAAGEFVSARSMMAENPRRWWEEREGAGQPWEIGSASGPWAAWDDHFESRSEEIGWTEEERTATLTVRETNDYFRLLERGSVTNEIVYHFDDRGRIEGLVIRAIGERPPGRTDEFLAWGRDHEPKEIEYLMPGGEIDPSGDRPTRFRRLLFRWREAEGLPPLK